MFCYMDEILTYLCAGGGQFSAVGVHDGSSTQQLLEKTHKSHNETPGM